MRQRSLLVAVASLAGALAVAPPAHAGCAAPSSKYVGGTVRGSDGYDVNVQVSFSIISTAGVPIGMDGCKVSGYSATIYLNRTLPYSGAPHSANSTYKWKLSNLPSNASVVWIENWPRNTTKTQHDYRKYGGSMRRKVPVNRGDVRLTMPVTCAYGGRTGRIWGKSYDRYGRALTMTHLYAWSEAPDSQTTTMGFGPATVYNGNYYVFKALAPGQTYVIWADAPGYATKRIYHVRVDACKTTSLSIRFP